MHQPISYARAAQTVLLRGVSVIAIFAGVSTVQAQTLKSSYTPAADNGGGSAAGRSDIVTIQGTTGTITGDYRLLGTSARPVSNTSSTFAQQNASGKVISGYDAIDGRVIVDLAAKQTVVTYPDLINGTNRTTTVYDNASLQAVNSVDRPTR